MSEMHDVVEMLLNRMKDYPEDFVDEPTRQPHRYREATKWERALSMAYEVASVHEKEALDIRNAEAKRAVYMGAALKTILSTDEELEKERPQLFHGKYTTTGAGIDLSTPSQIAISNTGLNKYAIQMEQRQKELAYQKAQREYELSKYTIGSTLG